MVTVPRREFHLQFRLYEALAAGAIPMILKEHANAGLAHVDVLGFKAVWLDTWKDAPKVSVRGRDLVPVSVGVA